MKRIPLPTLLLLTACCFCLFSYRNLTTVPASQSWQGVELGAPGSAGSHSINGAQLTVTGSGSGVGASPGGGEQGRFVYIDEKVN